MHPIKIKASNGKINIAVLHPFDPFGKKVGGIENFIKDFVKFAPKNFRITIVGTTENILERPLFELRNLPFKSNNHRYLPLLYEPEQNTKRAVPESLRFTIALSRMRNAFDGNILLFNRLELGMAFLGTTYKRIGIVHDDVQELLKMRSDSLWRFIPFIYRLMESFVLKTIDYVYAVNTSTYLLYKSKYRTNCNTINLLRTWVDRNIFIPSENNKDKLKDEISESLNINRDHTWLLFVGRLKAQKAPIRLVHSFYKYLMINKNANLIIIGEGNLINKVVNESKMLGIYDKIRILSYKSQKELLPFYQTADCLVLTSNYEGMPMSCMEALACGLPVVSTNVGELNRIINNENTGKIVNNFSSESIAKGIDKVINNRSGNIESNCLEAINNYTPDKVLRNVYNKLESLVI